MVPARLGPSPCDRFPQAVSRRPRAGCATLYRVVLSGPVPIQVPIRGRIVTEPSLADPNELEGRIEADAAWAAYRARIDEEVATAEQHLGVSAGTIAGIQSEPDYLFIVKIYATLEPILNQLLAGRLAFGRKITALPLLLGGDIVDGSTAATDEELLEMVAAMPLEGRSGKLGLCAALGCLNPRQRRYISALARVRNRFAHNIRNMSLTLRDIAQKMYPVEGERKKLLLDLMGWQGDTEHIDIIFALTGKEFIYTNMANLLADALHIMKPPPFTGMFGLPGSGGAIGDLGGLLDGRQPEEESSNQSPSGGEGPAGSPAGPR